MTATLFQQVKYSLEGLLNSIEMGEIGLPDIQRPFIWVGVAADGAVDGPVADVGSDMQKYITNRF